MAMGTTARPAPAIQLVSASCSLSTWGRERFPNGARVGLEKGSTATRVTPSHVRRATHAGVKQDGEAHVEHLLEELVAPLRRRPSVLRWHGKGKCK